MTDCKRREGLEAFGNSVELPGTIRQNSDHLVHEQASPRGLEQTGHHGFQSIWTMLRTPAITLPTHAAANGLPVGIQLVGRPGDDARLLATARWVFDRLGPWR